MNGNVMVEVRTPILVKDTDIWTPPQKGEIFLPNGRGGYELQKPLEERVDHEIKVKKGILSKDKVVVDGKTFVGKKKGKVLLAENYKPNKALRTAGVAALGLVSLLSTMKCGGGNRGGVNGPKPPRIILEVYNHTQGYLKTVDSGELTSQYSIGINQLGVSGVDNMRWAVRQTGFGDKVATGYDGIIRLPLPSTEVNYDLFLFNTGNNADYVEMDAQGAILLNGKHNLKGYRQDYDGQTGNNKKYPQRVWTGDSLPEIGGNPGVYVQIDSIMHPEKAPYRYGSVQASPTPINGADFTYGYADCGGADGQQVGNSIRVNADKLGHDIKSMVATGIRESFERFTDTDDLNQYIQSQGVLRASAQDRLCYILIMN